MARFTFALFLIVSCTIFYTTSAGRSRKAGTTNTQPAPRVLPPFKKLAHGVSSGPVTIKDTRTIFIKNLKYDGAGPDAYFWVGKGSTPNKNGRKVPDETGSYQVIRGYRGEDIELILPKGMTVKDIDYLAIYCVAFNHNFGHVLIPKDINVPEFKP